MSEELICAECGAAIEPDGREVMADPSHDDEGRPYHWSCLQELYERERLADGEDA